MAAILFTDIVGYSELGEFYQKKVAEELNGKCRQYLEQAVQYQNAHPTAETVVAAMPTGDGVVICLQEIPGVAPDPGDFLLKLAFFLQDWGRSISNTLPLDEIHFRIGLHAGELNIITDVNLQRNFCGYDINMAQRIMECGEADHILCSEAAYGKLFRNSPASRSSVHFEKLESPYRIKHGDEIRLHNITKEKNGLRNGNTEPPRAHWRLPILPHAQTGFKEFYSCDHLTVVGITNDQIAPALRAALEGGRGDRALKGLTKLDVFYASDTLLAGMPQEENVISPKGTVQGNKVRDLETLQRERKKSIATVHGLNSFGIEVNLYEYKLLPIAGIVAGNYENKMNGVIRVTHYVWGRNAGSCPTMVLRWKDLPEVCELYVEYLKLLEKNSTPLVRSKR